MAVTIDVFGSRVSRDLFRYVQSGKYQFRRCVTGIPISTLYEKAFSFQPENLEQLDLDEYGKTILQMQTSKLLPHLLKKKKSDYLIIDLADERMPRLIMESADGTGQLAYPEEYEEEYKALIAREKAYTLVKVADSMELDLHTIERKYKQFAAEILYSEKNPDGYRPEQIIILEALYSKNILTNEAALKLHDKKYRVKESNEWLRGLYAMLYKYLPDCKMIRIPENNHTTQNHLNGVHPLHYMQDTYLYMERALDVICRYSNVNTLENLWKEQSLKNRIETRSVKMKMVYALQRQVQELSEKVDAMEKRQEENE